MMLHSKPLLVATTTTLLLLLGGLGRALALSQINRPSDASLPAAIAAATPKAPITPITPTAPTTPTTPATSKAAAIPAAIAAAAPKTLIAPIPPITSKAAAIHPDDLYHCDDPSNASNKLACDPTTFRWKLEDLDASGSPDDSNLCNELVAILVRSREQQKLDEGQLGNGHSVVGVWESTALGTTVDRLEPCVLWAMTYGPLVVGDAGSSLADSASGQQEHVFVKDSDSPETTELFVDFDPILVALVWDRGISIPLSLDSAELHDLTGSHMLESLRAAIGHDTVEAIELTVAEGVPDFATDSLPLTLTGRVVFRDPKQALGPSSLRKVLLQSAFVDPDAMDLYLLRLRIARDATLNEVDVVVAGREALTDFFLGNANKKSNDYGSNNGDNNGNNSGQSLIDLSELNVDESSELLVSNLLIAILSAVAAAIVAVMCFAYCLMCRSKTSGQASKTLEEHSLVDENDVETGKRYRDGLPAVQTAPTGSNDDDDDEDDHRTGSGATNYDIEYMTGSQVDDGVSDYEMDTLPPPSTTHTDDEGSFRMRMTVIGDGYEDEDIMPSAGEEEDDVEDDEDARSAASDASASLYSYIPDDTSVSASLVQATGTVRTTPTHSNRSGQQQPSQSQSQSQSRSKHRSERPETTLEKTQKKSILWSVMDTLKKAPSDTTADSDKAEIYIETGASSKNSSASLSSLHKTRTTSPSAMLGPTSDNDSQSRDSNSLLYATDDDDNSEYGATSKAGIMSHRLKQNPYEYPEDSKEQFEKLWKNDDDDNDNDNDDDDDDDNDHDNDYDNDENHYDNNLHPGHNTSFDEAESVLGFVSSERAARKSREADRGPEPEDLVDWVPDEQAAQANEDDEESADQRVLPLPTALGSTAVTPAPASAVALDDCSVASSVSGQSNTSKNARGPMSARTKKNVWSSGSSVGSASVASTDSSMLRSLLGQSDTNDAALVFGSKQPARTKGEAQGKGQTQSSKERPTRDDSSSGSSSGSTPDVDLSMSSCTSTQLKSLLTHNGDDKDLSYEEDGLLFSETAAPPATTTTTTATTTAAAAASAATRGVEEEKKEGDFDDGDDRDATKMYLPASIRPASTATSPRNFDDNDDATVYSAFSEAPSVDGSIKSSMGWF